MFESAVLYNNGGTVSIENWDVSNVGNMSSMFYSASAFNRDISNWNTNNVTNMDKMFNDAATFNADISNWNIQNLQTAVGMLNASSGTSSFSQVNYDLLLQGWEAQIPSIQSNVTLDVAQYFTLSLPSSASRSRLTSPPYNWTINDLGGI
jgi:surface protein